MSPNANTVNLMAPPTQPMQRPHTTSYKPKLLHTNAKLSPTMVATNIRLKISHTHLATSNSNKTSNIANKERNSPHDPTATFPEEEQQVAVVANSQSVMAISSLSSSNNNSSSMVVEATIEATNASNNHNADVEQTADQTSAEAMQHE